MQEQAGCNIRSARGPDAERLLEIRRRAILELTAPALSSEQAKAWAAGRDVAWMTMLVSAKPLWVAHLDELIVGQVAVDGSRVIGLYVDPAYSGRGIGSRLLAVAEGNLWACGERTVTLEASWNSEGFYLRRGYVPLADRPADGARPMQKTLRSSSVDRMDLVVRPATSSDAERIHALHLASVRQLCGPRYEPAVIEEWLRGRSPAGYLRGITQGATFVAQSSDIIVGFCEAVQGEIVAVFVDPAWAGRGVGAALLAQAWPRAASSGRMVRLESTLNAVGFYEHFGFRQIGRSTLRRNDVDVPVVIMEKEAG